MKLEEALVLEQIFKHYEAGTMPIPVEEVARVCELDIPTVYAIFEKIKNKPYLFQSRRQKHLARYKAKHIPLSKESKCSTCGSKENLHRHHHDYEQFLDIVVLCRNCHLELHSHDHE